LCPTGGLTQKQSLRGLLLRHLDGRSRGMGISFCHVDRVDLLQRLSGLLILRVLFSAYGIWPGRCTISKLRSNLGFSGAFPGAVTGWTTMVVTAAVYKLEDPNGWISN